MSASQAATWMGAIAAIGVIVDSAEVLARRSAFSDSGIYSYPLLRSGHRLLVSGRPARVLGGLLGYPGVLTLPVVQVASAAVLVTLPLASAETQRWGGAVACGLILGARMLFYARNIYGQDGSDQMLLVVLASAFAAHLAGDSDVATIFVAYAAAQLMLAYFTSGIAKAVSATWRSGRAIPGITRTIGYGQPRFGALLERRPRLSKALCWSVIVFECCAPLLVLAGPGGALALIGVGMCFHFGIALVMGLNIFVWSFAATYPAVLLVAERWEDLVL